MRLDRQEQITIEYGATIEENRVSIEMLRTRGVARDEQLSTLEQSAEDLQNRVREAEGNIERLGELESTLEAVRTRLETLEQTGLDDGRRIAELEDRIRGIEEGRDEELRRLDRIERALGIEE